MSSVFAPPPTAQTGSYVVAQPARTGSMGDILRASYTPTAAGPDDMNRLLAQLDKIPGRF